MAGCNHDCANCASKCDKKDFHEDQIVAFWMNPVDTIPTVHRITSINGDEVITKGDY